MKIILCKNNKNVKELKEFLDRNLRKVKFEMVDCIGECSNCKKKSIAKIDGKVFTGKDEYSLLKEIRKYLKKNDDLKYLNEDFEEDKKDDKRKDRPVKFRGYYKKTDDRIIVMLPQEFESENKEILIAFGDDSEDLYEIDENGSEKSKSAGNETDKLPETPSPVEGPEKPAVNPS